MFLWLSNLISWYISFLYKHFSSIIIFATSKHQALVMFHVKVWKCKFYGYVFLFLWSKSFNDDKLEGVLSHLLSHLQRPPQFYPLSSSWCCKHPLIHQYCTLSHVIEGSFLPKTLAGSKCTNWNNGTIKPKV